MGNLLIFRIKLYHLLQTLTTLNLQYIEIDDEVAKYLANGLRNNTVRLIF
jgi:hypothetical protein